MAAERACKRRWATNLTPPPAALPLAACAGTDVGWQEGRKVIAACRCCWKTCRRRQPPLPRCCAPCPHATQAASMHMAEVLWCSGIQGPPPPLFSTCRVCAGGRAALATPWRAALSAWARRAASSSSNKSIVFFAERQWSGKTALLPDGRAGLVQGSSAEAPAPGGRRACALAAPKLRASNPGKLNWRCSTRSQMQRQLNSHLEVGRAAAMC